MICDRLVMFNKVIAVILCINAIINAINPLLPTVPITTGYTESEAGFFNPIMWPYDRPHHAGLGKRSHAVLDPYPMMDHYYGHMTHPSAKYMKPEPMTYYQYADDPERYQANITVSVQSQVHSTFGTPSPSAMGYSCSQYNYSPYCSTTCSTTDSCGATGYSSHPTTIYSNPVAACTDPSRSTSSCSPIRSSVDETGSIAAVGDHGMGTPLTPPLSVSPLPPSISTSPSPAHSISPIPNTYLEKENTIGYRSGSSSPACAHDCDSTTHMALLRNEVIPKLPLQMLSDLSEGLPLPGM